MIRFIVFLVLSASLASACFATAVVDPSVAERLSCLERPQRPDLGVAHTSDPRFQVMRFKLRFEPGARSPRIEVLHAVQGLKAVEQATAYVESFRLPCLREGDPAVELIQELRPLEPSDPPPLPWTDARGTELCIVRPDQPVQLPAAFLRPELHLFLAQIRFEGDGAAPPQVKLVYSSGNPSFESAVMDFAKRYRMPCRKAGDPPFTAEQDFKLDYRRRPAVLPFPDRMGLAALIALAPEQPPLRADFDFDTMDCPFMLKLSLRQPRLANGVREEGPPNPNRAYLLEWLRQLPVEWRDANEAHRLFNSQITVTVPCGTLKLSPPPSPQGVSS